MHPRDRFWWALVFIAIISITIGLIQLLAPEYALELAFGDVNPLSKHLVASLGLLIALFSGMFLYAILDDTPQHIAVLWTGIQKFGTAIAVGIGVQHATYIAPVAALAAFDLIAGDNFNAILIKGPDGRSHQRHPSHRWFHCSECSTVGLRYSRRRDTYQC
jgi:hypothetical protein